MKSRSREIGSLNDRIALQFDRHHNSSAFDGPVKLQCDRTILNTNLAASRFQDTLQKRGPGRKHSVKSALCLLMAQPREILWHL